LWTGSTGSLYGFLFSVLEVVAGERQVNPGFLLSHPVAAHAALAIGGQLLDGAQVDLAIFLDSSSGPHRAFAWGWDFPRRERFVVAKGKHAG